MQYTKPDEEIKKLLYNIQNITIQMSNTFEQALLKHEQQFIKTYRIKITELIKLFEQLTKLLQDKFINNTLTNRLNIVLKQRDYFKYECLKINVQYQTVVGENNGLMGQIVSIGDQMRIYKRLLEDEKVKNKELEKNAEKFKNNFNEMAYKTLTQNIENINPTSKNNISNNLTTLTTTNKNLQKNTKKLQTLTKQLHEKNQIIRNLKIKISELELVVNQRQVKYFEKKELYEIFKACVQSWKRDIITKQRKSLENFRGGCGNFGEGGCHVGGGCGGNKNKFHGMCNSNSNTNTNNLNSPNFPTASYSSYPTKHKQAHQWNQFNPQKLTLSSKKQLLKYFFTSTEFLNFIEQLLFNPKLKVQFMECDEENQRYMVENRIKLFQYMCRKKIVHCGGGGSGGSGGVVVGNYCGNGGTGGSGDSGGFNNKQNNGNNLIQSNI